MEEISIGRLGSFQWEMSYELLQRFVIIFLMSLLWEGL